jgi:hypothetical protein
MAIGLLGMGSGLGFFFGPQIAGWRNATAAWHFASVAQWQKPCVEMGIAGVVFGLVYLIVACDPGSRAPRKAPVEIDRQLRNRILKLGCVLGFRDFAGVATLSLASIYVQKAFGRSVREAGLMVGLMMLPSVFVNPIFVFLSPRKRRLPMLALTLITGGLFVCTTPAWPMAFIVIVLCSFQTLNLGSYALSDAAMYERVDAAMRGRIAGLFLMVAGTMGALGPWVMGGWTDLLGSRASHPQAYFGPFGFIALAMFIAAFSPRLLAKLGPARRGPPLSWEIEPATMDVMG